MLKLSYKLNAGYDEVIYKKIYIILFQHIKMILIPGSEFDVLKKTVENCAVQLRLAGGPAGYNDERYGGKAVIENNNDGSNIDTIST